MNMAGVQAKRMKRLMVSLMSIQTRTITSAILKPANNLAHYQGPIRQAPLRSRLRHLLRRIYRQMIDSI